MICDCSDNGITSLGIEAIAQSFNNLIHLKGLWLGCEFSFDLSVNLDFFHLLSLFTGLFVTANKIDDEGVAALMQHLPPSITKLGLSCQCVVGDLIESTLKALFSRHVWGIDR